MNADGNLRLCILRTNWRRSRRYPLKNNVLKGADLSGGRYSGALSERPNGAGYKIAYDMFVPPHVFLVQGASPQELAHTRSGVTLDLPPDFE
jgi:hypothetical protein